MGGGGEGGKKVLNNYNISRSTFFLMKDKYQVNSEFLSLKTG